MLSDLLPDSKATYDLGPKKFTTIYLSKDSPLIKEMLDEGMTVIVYETKIIEILKPQESKT